MKVRQSLLYRMRSFVEREGLKEIATRNALDVGSIEAVPREMLEIMESVRNYLSRADVLLDVGAHRGLFTRAANAFHPFRKSICFEPNAARHADIHSNTTGLDCDVLTLALSDHEGEQVFYLHMDDSMSSLMCADDGILRSEFPYDQPEGIESTRVRTSTLDETIRDLRLENATFFLKIDTQGNELDVLTHASGVLKRTEACLIEHMFLSPYERRSSFHDLVAFMDAQGFECVGALTVQKRPSKRVSGVDFLFASRNTTR